MVLLINILFLSILAFAQDNDSADEDIRSLTREMENYFNNGELQKIADLYTKNAYIVTPDKVIRGKDKINEYWTNIKDPVNWELETMEISLLEEDIYDNQYYSALENKPPGWRQRGIELDDDKPLVFQLGRSTLKSKDESGTIHNSVVDFILVWQVQTDGTYKIILDTYTW